jgi:predicted phosphoribosyltransferase
MRNKFNDREEAGYILGEEIKKKETNINLKLNEDNCVVLAIPDEGIIPAYTLTKSLGVKMNLLVVGKLRFPKTGKGFGSITIDGTRVLNDSMINKYRLTEEHIKEIEKYELDRMINRIEAYDIAQINLKKCKDKFIILVDEGAQTGYSMIAAIKSINLTLIPKVIVVAVPTASFNAIMVINRYTPHIVCPKIVDSFSFNVSDAYKHYHKLDEETVLSYIDKLKKEDILFK